MTADSRNQAVVFGASGALGSAVVARFAEEGRKVVGMSRESGSPGLRSLKEANWAQSLGEESVSSVVWAQGLNSQGGIREASPDEVRELFEANVVFIVDSLRQMLLAKVFASRARLVVVSSVWQDMARDQKLAYTTSKAAVAGLVRSLAVDLSSDNIEVNAVLPGVVDTPMTREFLSPEQLERLEDQTPGGCLVSPEQVAAVCVWLAGSQSCGVNGEFVRVDGGWSGTRDF